MFLVRRAFPAASALLTLTFAQGALAAGGYDASAPAAEPAREPAPIPPAEDPNAASADSSSEDSGGMYFAMTAGAMFGLEATHQWAGGTNCPSAELPISEVPGAPSFAWNPGCSATAPIGFTAEGRLGYAIGHIFGLEGFALVAGDWSSGSLTDLGPLEGQLPSWASDMQVGRIGGGLGGGIRLMTPKGPFRLSVGGGGGVMFRHVYTNISSTDGSSTGYTAPMVRADVGIVLLNLITIGAMGFVEFSGTVDVTPRFEDVVVPPELGQQIDLAVGPVTVSEGNQFFIGPFVGFAFGG